MMSQNMVSAMQEMVMAAVTDFVAYAAENGVTIPSEVVDGFAVSQDIRRTPTGKISKRGARGAKVSKVSKVSPVSQSVRSTGRGTGKKSPGKKSAFFLYLGEKNAGKSIEEMLKTGVTRDAEIERLHATLEGADEKVKAKLQKFENACTAKESTAGRDWPTIPRSMVTQYGGLVWASETDAVRAQYSQTAKRMTAEATVAADAHAPEPAATGASSTGEALPMSESKSVTPALPVTPSVAESDTDADSEIEDDNAPSQCETEDCTNEPSGNMRTCSDCSARQMKKARRDKVADKRQKRAAEE